MAASSYLRSPARCSARGTVTKRHHGASRAARCRCMTKSASRRQPARGGRRRVNEPFASSGPENTRHWHAQLVAGEHRRMSRRGSPVHISPPVESTRFGHRAAASRAAGEMRSRGVECRKTSRSTGGTSNHRALRPRACQSAASLVKSICAGENRQYLQVIAAGHRRPHSSVEATRPPAPARSDQ